MSLLVFAAICILKSAVIRLRVSGLQYYLAPIYREAGDGYRA